MSKRIRAALVGLGIALVSGGVAAILVGHDGLADREPPPSPPSTPPPPTGRGPSSTSPSMSELRVSTEPPGLEVFVDGTSRGHSPVLVAVRGGTSHVLHVRHQGAEASSTVQVEAGETHEVVLAPIPPERPRLQIVSVPTAARVALAGIVVGETPLEVSVQPGEHRVRVSLPGVFEERMVEVAADEGEKVVSFVLTSP